MHSDHTAVDSADTWAGNNETTHFAALQFVGSHADSQNLNAAFQGSTSAAQPAPAGAGTANSSFQGHAMAAVFSDAGGPLGNYGLNETIRTVSNTSVIGTTGNFQNQDVNGLLHGTAWNTTSLTYSFPTSSSNYGTSGTYDDWAAASQMFALSAPQQSVVRYAFGLISQYTPLQFTEITETDSTHATLRFADSNEASIATSYGYYPYGPTDFVGYNGSASGDAYFYNIRNDTPTKAGYAFDTFMHELGHTLGLKHGQDDDGTHGVLPANHDSTEWSIMDYHPFVGGPTFYDNEEGSGNQTYMVDDISALQYIYGANFSTNSGKTTYSWNSATGEMSINGVGQGASSTNTIYEAIWDGNGKDTYNLSSYTTGVHVDLRPGEWSTFSKTQLPFLSREDHTIRSPGNIDNANLYNDDPRSLIENATGGSGNDVLTGNAATNVLTGNAGNDTFLLHEANLADGDKYIGGSGIDTFDISQVHPAAGGVVDLAHGKWTIGANHETLNTIENVNGSSASETIDGSTAKNLLAGNNGNDKISGNSGNDTLQGGAGKDFLTGGAGADKLSGGVGTDHFIYTKITESITARSGRDTISDFSDAQKDRIDLHLIDADTTHRGNQKFDFIGKSNFSHHADELRYSVDAHGNVTIQADVNGDGKSDFTVTLAHISHVVGGDFIL